MECVNTLRLNFLSLSIPIHGFMHISLVFRFKLKIFRIKYEWFDVFEMHFDGLNQSLLVMNFFSSIQTL